MAYYDDKTFEPYTDLAEANDEVRYCYETMFQERHDLTLRLFKTELTNRRLRGTVAKLEAELKALKGSKPS